MNKIFAVLLIVGILASMLSACNGSPDETVSADDSSATTSTVEVETIPDILLVAEGKTDYVIVCPEKSQPFVKDAVTNLRSAISEKFNVTLVVQDDWVRELGDEGYVSDACEILIGATNRKESREVLAALKPGEYKVCADGNKIVITGSNDYLTSVAVEAFIRSSIHPADGTQLVLPGDYVSLEKQADFYGVLSGITMYAMGDSYFGGTDIGKKNTWVNLMGEKYAMHYVNYGIGGSTMSNYITFKNPMVERFTMMEQEDADVILLEGGRNDRTHSVPLGTVSSRDSQTFMGAINLMLDSMLQTYPNALIVLITPWYASGKVAGTGLSNIDYANAMRSVANHRDDPRVVCLYAADRQATGVNMDDSSFRVEYCINPNDVSHLNKEGMKMIQPYMEKFIATELAKLRGVSLDS